MLSLDLLCSQLRRQAQMIQACVEHVDEVQSRWRPAAGEWSMQEVICHLADEEREDFRSRLDLLLHRPADPWTPIDPAGWVKARAYNERDWSESVQDFLAERERSLAWLAQLVEPNWNAPCMAPWDAIITPGDMAAAWLAHDLLHLRQLDELHYAWTVRTVSPFNVDYAGDW